MEGEDALEDEHVGAVHGHGLGLPAVADEVVDGHLHLPALLQPLQGVLQQLEVERVLKYSERLG